MKDGRQQHECMDKRLKKLANSDTNWHCSMAARVAELAAKQCVGHTKIAIFGVSEHMGFKGHISHADVDGCRAIFSYPETVDR
mmetsp:Transcript_5243/g.14854  ORF Transcript_5243/g.14854 Transcript_5243/m.14854 type:complete len:83 (+) Transcript_5243:156-404(+)